MKVSKDATRDARRIFTLCAPEGRIDETKIRIAIEKIATKKPRGYHGILYALKRLVRLNLESHQATIESSSDFNTSDRVRIEKSLTNQYGEGLNFTYKTNPALLGGVRIRVGNDVLDGSVQSRINRLADAF